MCRCNNLKISQYNNISQQVQVTVVIVILKQKERPGKRCSHRLLNNNRTFNLTICTNKCCRCLSVRVFQTYCFFFLVSFFACWNQHASFGSFHLPLVCEKNNFLPRGPVLWNHHASTTTWRHVCQLTISLHHYNYVPNFGTFPRL